MQIAMVALQANPLSPSADTGPGQAGPDSQAERVSSLARALTGLDHRVTVYARKDAASLPRKAALAPGVTVEYVPACPPEPLPADKLAAHVPAFSAYLAESWQHSAPDVAHAHYWISGLAALAGARGLPVPVVQTFQSLGVADRPAGTGKPERRPMAGNGTARLRLEPVIARSVRAVLAGSSAEMSALTQLGVPRGSVRVVPRGVDTTAFQPEGPAAERTGRPGCSAWRRSRRITAWTRYCGHWPTCRTRNSSSRAAVTAPSSGPARCTAAWPGWPGNSVWRAGSSGTAP